MVKTFYPIQTSFSILGYFSQSTTFDYNSRYVESIQNMLREAETPEIIELEKVEKQKIYIKITL